MNKEITGIYTDTGRDNPCLYSVLKIATAKDIKIKNVSFRPLSIINI